MAPVPMGVNLAGPEFGGTNLPGVYNVDYTFPTDAELQYYQSKGLTLIRLPLKWERLQHTLFSTLDSGYLALSKTFFSQAAARGMQVVLGLSDYARYQLTTPPVLQYSDGTAATGIAVSGITADSYFNSPTTPDLFSYWMQTQGSTKTVTITGLTASGAYTLYLYGSNGSFKNRGTTFSITTGSGSPHAGSNASTLNAAGTTYVLNTNYVIFDVTASGAGTLVISYTANTAAQGGANTEGDFNGLQLIAGSGKTLDINFSGIATHAVTVLGAYTGDSVGSPVWNNLLTGNVYPIGSTQVPVSAFSDLWTKLATAFKTQAGVYGYDLMDEPHDMPSTSTWPTAAQAATTAIRAVDTSTLIIVQGDGYAGARLWNTLNSSLNITDPNNNLMYEAHCFFDDGGYSLTYSQLQSAPNIPNNGSATGPYPGIGVAEVQPFLTWLTTNNFRGYVGSYGIPNNDSPWLTVLDQFLTALNNAGVPGTYWAGGPWWGSYLLSCEPSAVPSGGTDAVQMSILQKHPTYEVNMPFPTATVTQGSGLTINTLPNAGQQPMANSLGVVIASDQSVIPVTSLASGAITNPSSILTRSALLTSGNVTVSTSVSPYFTWTTAPSSPLVNGQGVYLGGTTAPGAFTAGVTYYVRDVAGNTFNLSAALGGPAIVPTSAGTAVTATMQYKPNDLIANSALFGSVAVPFFSIPNTAGGAIFSRIRLIASLVSFSWQGVNLSVNMWNGGAGGSTPPTYTNGDAQAYAVATGGPNWLANFLVTMTQFGDAAAGAGQLTGANETAIKLAAGTSVYWDLQIASGFVGTSPSQTFTLIPELLN